MPFIKSRSQNPGPSQVRRLAPLRRSEGEDISVDISSPERQCQRSQEAYLATGVGFGIGSKQRSLSSVAISPEIDKRIIEGYLTNREEMFEELGRVGFAKQAIIDRAGTLGLSASFVSKSRAGGVNPTVRRCLCCDQSFVSLGPQNRLCNRCRNRS